jgi:Polysaccharide lyase family 4, domain II
VGSGTAKISMLREKTGLPAPRSFKGEDMRRVASSNFFLALVLVASGMAFAQNDYKVVTVIGGGTISGSVKWSGPVPHSLDFPVTKDAKICDPDSNKTADLERLIVGPQGGVANTVVYLKNITSGKAMDLPVQRRHLDQKNCRYVPHILLVPQNATLDMMSSDATLHTIHMDGAATFNLPFPFPGKVSSRTMQTPGLVNLRCNGGHVWMNAEMFVAPHPYYAVTDESGHFEFTDVPPGTYQIVAWHEGWNLTGKEQSFDVLTERSVQRPVFSQPKTWEKSVTVSGNQASTVDFVVSNK